MKGVFNFLSAFFDITETNKTQLIYESIFIMISIKSSKKKKKWMEIQLSNKDADFRAIKIDAPILSILHHLYHLNK